MPTRTKYAAGTEVSVAKSESELKELLRRRGATNIGQAEPEGWVVVVFDMERRRVRLRMPIPKHADFRHRPEIPEWKKRHRRTAEEQQRAWEQACREQWRALVLGVKAMFSNIDSGLWTFETAFLPFILMPDGKTVGEHALPAIAQSYESGRMPSVPLLPAGTPGER